MKAYIDGALSTKQQCFLPEDLWFATDDCEDNMEISDTCVCLSGIHIESSVEDTNFTCRWKGVELSYINKQGENVYTEDFSINDFIELVEKKNMRLVNMGVYCDHAVNAKITNLVLIENGIRYEFDPSRIDELEIIEDEEK